MADRCSAQVLVCGGAGYIGSHVVRELSKLGDKYEIVVLDNLSTGHTQAVPSNISVEVGDIRDKVFLEKVFSTHKPVAVMHLCASISVGESVKDPLGYYENNVSGTITLLQAMQKHDAKYFIFSSTAALFGYPKKTPIEEEDPTFPINPYGDTKLAIEFALKWVDQAHGIKYVCLRYFNACGADASGEIGEDHQDETHLIPLILQVPLGKREKIFIFGDDYNTHDGTCIRDYVHVTDIARAHIGAIDYLVKTNESNRFNLGSGKGYTVKEIVDAARKVTGHPIPAEIKTRRPGDPDALIASSERAEKVLGWTRQYKSVEDIVSSAWRWHQTHPTGYPHA
ncbi:hypothetical protein HDU67_005476 [Dinochytrium kinnereticum]|nr:hypothetical protein HDU67_005476 [Dinochytrium kinnereticum]